MLGEAPPMQQNRRGLAQPHPVVGGTWDSPTLWPAVGVTPPLRPGRRDLVSLTNQCRRWAGLSVTPPLWPSGRVLSWPRPPRLLKVTGGQEPRCGLPVPVMVGGLAGHLEGGDIEGPIDEDPGDCLRAGRGAEGALVGDETKGVGEQKLQAQVLEEIGIICRSKQARVKGGPLGKAPRS